MRLLEPIAHTWTNARNFALVFVRLISRPQVLVVRAVRRGSFDGPCDLLGAFGSTLCLTRPTRYGLRDLLSGRASLACRGAA
jgi:hypothetical protein